MTSQINPYNIDGAYPVAGQDNNSQGFRTNFTNTSTNFEFANQEITDLQNNAILKSALTGTTLDNDMGGSILYNAQTYMITQTVVPLGSVVTSANLNYEAGAYFTLDVNSSVSLTAINLPAAGVLATYSVQANVANAAATVAFTSAGGWVVGNHAIQGVAIANTTATVSFAATGIYTFVFTTNVGGPSSPITTLNTTTPRLHPFNNSSEDLANVAAANLAVTTSYFTTAVAETATLAAGVAGQIKTFCLSPPSLTLSSVTITGTGGTFSCSATTLEVGQKLTIAGTLGGTGSITGYSDPTAYFIIATNGSTTFTLSTTLGGGAITTTAGTPTGVTYHVVGPMVITVTNAGWKTSGIGTITFDTTGDACTLQYVNANWFCIGNNGCVFA